MSVGGLFWEIRNIKGGERDAREHRDTLSGRAPALCRRQRF